MVFAIKARAGIPSMLILHSSVSATKQVKNELLKISKRIWKKPQK